jgi:hypothetical protein
VVVCDLDVIGISCLPTETNSKLIVDEDAVLTMSISSEPFQSIAGWDCQI